MDIENLYNDINLIDIEDAKKDIGRAYNFLSKDHNKYPSLDGYQLLSFTELNFIKASQEYYKIIDRLSGIKVQLLARDYLLENEQFLKHLYQKFSNKKIPDDDGIYTYDLKKSTNLLVRSLLYNLREKYKEYGLNPTTQEEYEYLKNSLQYCKDDLLRFQKDDNIKILQYTYNYLNEHGALDLLCNSQEKQLKILWLEDLGYVTKPDKNHPDDIGIEKFFSEEYLKTLPIDELSALNIFWQNKYSKEINSTGFGYFVFQQLNLLKDFPNTNLSLDDETIKKLLTKYRLLKYLAKNIYKRNLQGKSYKSLSSEFSFDYNHTFSKLFPNFPNSLEDDLSMCFERFIAAENTYSIKNNLICGIIMDFVDNKKLKNWGYINENENGKPNTIQDNSKKIIIGIDYPRIK